MSPLPKVTDCISCQSLDLQYTAGLATDVPIFVLSVGSQTSDGIDGFLDAINALLGQDPAPQVLTTSFGFNEQDLPAPITMLGSFVQVLVQASTDAVNQQPMQRVRTTRGAWNHRSFRFWRWRRLRDTAHKGLYHIHPYVDPFNGALTRPNFLILNRPHSVTSVGGTTSFGPEVAASLSAGGFSQIFARPAYQNASVSAYLQTLGNTNSGLFNSSGRAYPDIAAQAQNFQIFINGQVLNVDGTSAASPTVASIIALVNDAILAGGGLQVGFLNPLLYSSAARAMNDITQGSNPGCGTNGFPATTGWDPVCFHLC